MLVKKRFVTNRVGDFGLLLGVLGFYWITGSFEFRDLFEIFNNLVYNNEVNLSFPSYNLFRESKHTKSNSLEFYNLVRIVKLGS